MKAYMLRGQGTGIQTDKVFVTFPTPEQLREGLKAELALHGKVVHTSPDGEGTPVVTEIEPLVRWISVHEVELVGINMPDAVVPAEPVWRIEGQLSAEELNEMFAEVRQGPPGVHRATSSNTSFEGAGSVVNPGEPGWKPMPTNE